MDFIYTNNHSVVIKSDLVRNIPTVYDFFGRNFLGLTQCRGCSMFMNNAF